MARKLALLAACLVLSVSVVVGARRLQTEELQPRGFFAERLNEIMSALDSATLDADAELFNEMAHIPARVLMQTSVYGGCIYGGSYGGYGTYGVYGGYGGYGAYGC